LDGDFSFIRTTKPQVLAMRYDWRGNSVVCMHNFSPQPQEVRFATHAKGEPESTLVNLLSEDHSYPEANGRHCILLEPYGYRWFRMGGLDYLLKRTEV
jgi:maltose alpha-D-glucosyltransferase/alpha-amylase